MVRPLSMTVIVEEGRNKSKLSIPSRDGMYYYQVWAYKAAGPAMVMLYRESQATAIGVTTSTDWTDKWEMDTTTQPDGTESVCPPYPFLSFLSLPATMERLIAVQPPLS
jgi:hypothetical protein